MILTSACQIKTSYFDNFVSSKNETRLFVDAIHHFSRSGNLIAFAKENSNNKKISFFSNNNSDIIDFHKYTNDLENPNIYLALNSFVGQARKTDKLFAINGFYIDLDGHDISASLLEEKKYNTQEKINELINNGDILPPTMITSTGRGYGLYYIFDKSINAQCSQLVRFYDFIYSLLIRRFKDFFDSDKYLSVDTQIKDKCRVVRLPGTVNQNNKEMCRLYDNDIVYYGINEIKEGFQLFETYHIEKEPYAQINTDEKRIIQKKDKIINLAQLKGSQLSESRLKIYSLVKELKESQGLLSGYREVLLFLNYNALVQVIDRDEAKKQIEIFNNSFEIPLSIKELKGLFKSVDTNVAPDGTYSGYYKITNDQIAEKLDLSKEDIKNVGLGLSIRYKEREALKAKTKEKKDKRVSIIKKIKTDNPSIKRTELLILVNKELTNQGLKEISLHTLDRCIKELKETSEVNQKIIELKSLPKIVNELCDDANINQIDVELEANINLNTGSIIFEDDLFNTEKFKDFYKWLEVKELANIFDELYELPMYSYITLTEFYEWKSFLCNLSNGNKRLVKKFFKFIEEIKESNEFNYYQIFEAILKEYHVKKLAQIQFKQYLTPAQKENAKYYNQNQQKWNWLKDTSIHVSDLLKLHRNTYLDIYNRLCEKNSIIFVNKIPYSLKDFKSKIMYHLTIDDICDVCDLGICEENDILAEWLEVVTKKGFIINPISINVLP